MSPGLLVLGGAIADGGGILAAQAAGADLVYVGTRFLAAKEANVSEEYKQALIDAQAADIVYTPHFSGVPANYLAASVAAHGYEFDTLSTRGKGNDMANHDAPRPWRDIWSAGQGVGQISDAPPVADIVARMREEYASAWSALTKTEWIPR